jgi:hypothetical protein
MTSTIRVFTKNRQRIDPQQCASADRRERRHPAHQVLRERREKGA